jgi:hypothetical protein
MTTTEDWYPTSEEGERSLYANIEAKVDEFKTKYSCLTDDYLGQIHTMCLMFIEGYDKKALNRAASKAATTWFQNVVGSKQKSEAVSAPPVFQAFVIPAGALAGLEQQCRTFARLMKGQANYDKADGLDLMIEKSDAAELDLAGAMPVYTLTVSLDGKVTNVWKKDGFDMLEWQYRRAGEQMWQPIDKSTEKTMTFTPTLTTPGVPEKFEFRAVYLIKNIRVGQWSPTFTLTIG